ncbi:glycosyltransferase [Desulfosporosinus sp. PR]|uniref:glycosyltransferase n=1 Tax=Candidatus Desulfosporosinus nitrosoreducens TaxID=3401928 RepID=UPI0027EEE0BB|nr:glycosyltransferase [Desulfosporosinus sp. PR]MDQ7095575.1 glycosyltransferase [Desulfosporosinus sp. PR]
MRVLILSHMYPNAVSPLGGIFVRQQAVALSRLGVDVRVVAPVPWVPGLLAGRGKWGGYPAVPFWEQPDGFPVFHPRVLEFPRSLFFEYYPTTFAQGIRRVFLDQIGQGVDLIHAHVAHPDGAAARKFAQTYNLPLVVTIHGQDFAYTLKRSHTCAESVRATLREASQVILVSEKLRNQYGLATWADTLAKYKVVYNGVDLEDVLQPPQPEGEDTSKTGNGHRLLSVGFLRPDKGHAVVLQALPELVHEFPDLEYRIVGAGSEGPALQTLTRELGLERHVVFLGSLPHPEAMAEMSQCAVFILPSWKEAFGVVYLEAMAYGKPIIGTQGEGIAEILDKTEVGIAVPPQNVPAVAAAIRELFRHPQRAQEMGVRGRELVSREFTWRFNAEKTLEVYQEAQRVQRET